MQGEDPHPGVQRVQSGVGNARGCQSDVLRPPPARAGSTTSAEPRWFLSEQTQGRTSPWRVTSQLLTSPRREARRAAAQSLPFLPELLGDCWAQVRVRACSSCPRASTVCIDIIAEMIMHLLIHEFPHSLCKPEPSSY